MNTKKKIPEKYTKEWFAEMGRKGGTLVKERYGINHYVKMKKKAVENSKAKIKKIKISQ